MHSSHSLGGLSVGLGGLMSVAPLVISVGAPPAPPQGTPAWPLEVSPNGHHLVDANGTPFLVIGDTPWSLPVNCTNAQIDTYLADRAGKGCTAILIEGCERAYSSQTPAYLNVDGEAPFTSMSPVNWVMNDAFWNRVDYIVNSCKALGMVVFMTPAYTGVGNGSDGWRADYSGVSDATLQAYGAALASRYTQGNVVWVLGGDDANDSGAAGDYGSGTTPDRTKQWQIVLGMRTVRTTDLVSGHTARNGAAGAVNGEAFKAWTTGYTGFNLNNVYTQESTDDGPGLAAAAYARTGFPFFMIEAGYQNIDNDLTPSEMYPVYQTVLGGGLAGWFGGHDALWHMGSYDPNTGAASVLSTYLAGSWLPNSYFGALLTSYAWHLLEPRTDSSFVTTAKGTGSATICPALASDGSFGMVWTNNVNFTVDMTSLAPASVRARWWNPSTGTFTDAGTFSNTGTQAFTAPGARILVLDAAP